MKTPLVYVLVSTIDDIYLEQAYVSMFSAKYYNPNSYIILLTDKDTEKTFTGVRKTELKYADQIISVDLDTELYTAKQRSRILKANARKYINGDYLFIDCDTIVVSSLEDIDKLKCDIACVKDLNCSFLCNFGKDIISDRCKELDFELNEQIYFNTGIMYVRDCQNCHTFYELWYAYLLDSFQKNIVLDQPAFAKVNQELNYMVDDLGDIWNCQLPFGVKYLKDAKIVHYLCTIKPSKNSTLLFVFNDENILKKIKVSAEIPVELVTTVKDVFSGLASPCQLYVGEDVLFWQTRVVRNLRKIYNTKLFLFAEKLFFLMSKIYVLFKRG